MTVRVQSKPSATTWCIAIVISNRAQSEAGEVLVIWSGMGRSCVAFAKIGPCAYPSKVRCG
jgi:hypothetical protein